MENLEPLTPCAKNEEVDCYAEAYKQAAEYDEYLFGDYDFCKEWLDNL